MKRPRLVLFVKIALVASVVISVVLALTVWRVASAPVVADDDSHLALYRALLGDHPEQENGWRHLERAIAIVANARVEVLSRVAEIVLAPERDR